MKRTLRRIRAVPSAGVVAAVAFGRADIGRLSHTAVSAVPPSSACVACVCRIQRGVARRSFSAPAGQSFSKTDAAVAKNRFMMPHSRVAVIPAWSSRQPMIAVPGDHFEWCHR